MEKTCVWNITTSSQRQHQRRQNLCSRFSHQRIQRCCLQGFLDEGRLQPPQTLTIPSNGITALLLENLTMNIVPHALSPTADLLRFQSIATTKRGIRGTAWQETRAAHQTLRGRSTVHGVPLCFIRPNPARRG